MYSINKCLTTHPLYHMRLVSGALCLKSEGFLHNWVPIVDAAPHIDEGEAAICQFVDFLLCHDAIFDS